MAKSFATLINEVQSDLGDDTITYTDAKVTVMLEKSIKTVSDYVPHVMMHSFDLESRTGTATTDTNGALVDSSAQFVDVVDIGKVIYNTTDNTWAVVTAFVSTSELTLSKDIMVDGDEDYQIFNKGCWNSKQINIEDVTDYIGADRGVVAVEYKTQKSTGNTGSTLDTRNYRNWTVEGDILTVDIDFTPPDSSTSGADIEVFVWFNKRQRVSQLADLAGTVNGTPAAGATTFTIAAVGSGTDVIAEDTLFTVAGVRGTYKMKYDLTLSGGGGAIIFWPGLESAPSNGAIVAFVGSTLSKSLEKLVVEMAAAYSALSLQANAIPKGGQAVFNRYEGKLALALSELRGLGIPETSHTWPKD